MIEISQYKSRYETIEVERTYIGFETLEELDIGYENIIREHRLQAWDDRWVMVLSEEDDRLNNLRGTNIFLIFQAERSKFMYNIRSSTCPFRLRDRIVCSLERLVEEQLGENLKEAFIDKSF